MKVKLVVASGVHAGREILIAGTEFVIGRDPQCQLRPSSPAISKRHCAIIVRGEKVFVRDFGSTNGTFLDGKSIQGEVEATGQLNLKAGPLDFTLVVEPTATPPKPAPVPSVPTKKPAPKPEDDEFAAFLLEGDAGGEPSAAVPEGSTIMEMGAVKPEAVASEKKDAPKPDAKQEQADTRSAAAEILRKYQRRPRS